MTFAIEVSKSDLTAPRSRDANRRRLPVLKTQRLLLRAPVSSDVANIVALAGERRVAENTARIPHPYGVDDARGFIEAVNRNDGEVAFAIVLDGVLIGVCGIDRRDSGPEIGYWLGAA